MTSMIRTVRLTKSFGRTVALAEVDLDVAPGACLGLTGPNGGGRTTLLRILAALLRPSAGRAEIDGLDVVRHREQIRSRVAYVGTEGPRGDGLCVREYLGFVADARRAGRGGRAPADVDAVVDRANLPAGSSVDALSEGLRQRVALAAALLIAPPVLLLDDPLRSMDAGARGLFTEWLREMLDGGTTLVVAFNDQSPLRRLCHLVAELDGGRLISSGRVAVPEPDATPAAAAARGDA